MKHKIILSAISIFAFTNISEVNAGAWLNPKGKWEADEGAYYSFPSTSYDRGILEGTPDVAYTAKSETRRIAQTSEVTYGLTNYGTLVGLLDIGYVRDKITTTLGNGEQFVISTDYFSIDPAFGYRHKLYEDSKQVLSAEGKLHAGEYIFGDDDSIYNRDMQAYSLALQYGRNFQSNLGFPNFFSGKRYHYFETIAGAKHYPHLGQTQWEAEFHFGLAVAQKVMIVAGMYNTWNGGQFDRSPLNATEVASKVNATTLDAGQKTELIDILNDKARSRSTYHDHQLDLKIQYEVAKDRVVFVEGISSIISEKPFTNNALLVGLESKF